MPVFRVRRETQNWSPEDIIQLQDGKQLVSFNGLLVPITVEGDNIIVHLQDATGTLNGGTIRGMGDNWTFKNRGEEGDKTVVPEKDDPILLHIFSSGAGAAVLIESWAKRGDIK